MSVTLLTGSFPPRVCGVGDYSSRLADALHETGVPVAVRTRSANVPDWGVSGIRALVRSLETARPSLVHLQYERSVFDQSLAVCFLLPRLLKQAQIPLVTTFHALDGPTQWGKLHRLALLPLLQGSENVVVCSQRQERAVRRLPGLAARARLIPVGSVIPVTGERHSIDRARPLRLIYFGFVWRGRNLELLLETLAQIRQTHSSAILIIVGAVRDRAYQAELEAQAQELGIASAVAFRGELPVSLVSQALANADIALLPFASGVSTGRTTLMAALDHGLPIVTWGKPENLSPLFRTGDNLEIARLGDTTDFIRRTAALARDAEKRAQLSRGALRLAQAFAWPEIAQQIRALPAYQKAFGP